MLFSWASSDWRYLSATITSDEKNIHIHEVNCAPQQFAWKLQIYDDTIMDERALGCGAPLFLYLKATEGHLMAKMDNDSGNQVLMFGYLG